MCGLTDHMGKGIERIQQSQEMREEDMKERGDTGGYLRILSGYLMKIRVAEKSEKGEFKGYIRNGSTVSDVGQGLYLHKPVS